MGLKILIILLFIAVLISLMTGMRFFFKDIDVPDSKRLLYALGIRITFAALLLLTIGYGIYSGKLEINQVPWDKPETQN